MDNISLLIPLLNGRGWRYRIKTRGYAEPEVWEPWLIQPSPSYLETSTGGPIAIKQIEWIDIDTSGIGSLTTSTLSGSQPSNTELKQLLADHNINYAALDNRITRIVLSAL